MPPPQTIRVRPRSRSAPRSTRCRCGTRRISYPEFLIGYFKHPACKNPIWSPTTDREVMDRSLAVMRRYNVIGVVNDANVARAAWQAQAPDRIMVASPPTDEELADPKLLLANYTKDKAAGKLMLIGEVGAQYMGVAPDSPKLEGLWAAAEALDLPVSLHIGPGPPGTPYLPGMGYRARMSSPLLLEDVLVRHPKLRLNVMHAGYPMLDDTLALLYAHPQVYLDIGVIVYTQPRAAFLSLPPGAGRCRVRQPDHVRLRPDGLARSDRTLDRGDRASRRSCRRRRSATSSTTTPRASCGSMPRR